MSSFNYMKGEFVREAKDIYGNSFIPLHRPVFEGNEIKYLQECVKSNFVSSMSSYVDKFESDIAHFVGSKYAVSTVNGTSALHISLMISGVEPGDEVLTQALTFIATCNAITYMGASPVFIDVDINTMGMSPKALISFLQNNTYKKNGRLHNKNTKKKIIACIPMHTYGIPCRIIELKKICDEYGIVLIEDAAESLGSFSGNKHTGTFGSLGIFSFNGNKVITTGGGGMIVTDDEDLAKRAKHLTTTAKLSHPTEFIHDEIGYNYRLPGICAALGVAQVEELDSFLKIKELIFKRWEAFFKKFEIQMNTPLLGDVSNNWFNSIILGDENERDDFLAFTNEKNVMTRPIWELMPNLEMFKDCEKDSLKNSIFLRNRVVAISSSVPDGALFKYKEDNKL